MARSRVKGVFFEYQHCMETCTPFQMKALENASGPQKWSCASPLVCNFLPLKPSSASPYRPTIPLGMEVHADVCLLS